MAGDDPELIIDANLPKRLATELKNRGRRSVSTAQLGLKDAKDPSLLEILAERPEPWVLVTGDDKMPEEHAEVIAELRPTIATVDPRRDEQYQAPDQEDAWNREVVHKWAHKMATQAPGTIRRYSLGGHRMWTSRRRR